MADEKPFQQFLCVIPALGRPFQLGDLYDYRTDCIIKDDQLPLTPTILASATQVEHGKEHMTLISKDSEFNSNHKVQSMGLDSHSLASVMAGLIGNYQGASNFIKNWPDPREATLTLCWTYKSLEKYLDLKALVNHQNFPSLSVGSKEENKKRKTSGATHIVASVFYGAEIYCVFAQNLDGREEDEQVRKEAQKNLSEVVAKFENALSNKDVVEFKKEMNHENKHRINGLKCRLYADLQTEPFIECGFFDAYQHCFKLLEDIQKMGKQKAKTIPIAIQLCPLKVLFDRPEPVSRCIGDFRDVDLIFVDRCYVLLADLKRVVIKAQIMCEAKENVVCDAIREFIATVCEFQEALLHRLNRFVLKFRQNSKFKEKNLFGLIESVETHELFRLTKLDQWLTFKQSELGLVDWVTSETDKAITFLADRNQLEKHLTDKACSLVLFLPPLDEHTNAILAAMKKCSYNVSTRGETETQPDVQPWHTMQSKRKLIKDMVRQLASHVEKNQDLSDRVQFIVTFGESSSPFTCTYSIYEAGRLLKNNLLRLPDSPTGLRIRRPATPTTKKSSFIRAEWDYCDLGYPCKFVVEYRLKGIRDWTQQTTTKPGENQLSINIQTGSILEIRVAADTCIGWSEFSEILDTEFAVEELDAVTRCLAKNKNIVLQSPIDLKVAFITHDRAEFEWTPPPENYCCFFYRYSYWKKGEDPSPPRLDIPSIWTFLALDDLEPETTYMLHMASSTDYETETMTEPCPAVEFTTAKKIRFAETFVKRCQKVGREKGLDVYAVPLTKVTGRLKTADRFVFDAGSDFAGTFDHTPHTILLVGTSDSNKTSLINGIINYIFGVEKDDPFRFQLIDPSQVDGQVTIYDINHIDEFSILYTLKIIDISSYNKDIAENQLITKTMADFFNDKYGVQEVDRILFVLNSSTPHLTPLHLYIYCSLITIFGNDLKENIEFLLTFSDTENPPILAAIEEAGLVSSIEDRYYNFNSPTTSRSSSATSVVDSKCLSQWMDNFLSLLNSLMEDENPPAKCVSLSKQLLDEKKRLESVGNGLWNRLKNCMDKFLELWMTKKNVDKHLRTDTETEFEVDVSVLYQLSLPFGVRVTNCETCQISCHLGCGLKDGKVDCDVMDHSMPEENRTCRVCPGKCSWKVHSNASYKWAQTEEKQKTSCSAIRKRYETQLKKRLTWPEVTAKVNEEVDAKKKEATELIEVYLKLMDRLREFAERLIATSPYKHERCFIPMQVINYVKYIIKCEQSGSSTDHEERISNLRKLCADAHSLRLRMSRIYEDEEESDYEIPSTRETDSECETGEDEEVQHEEEEEEDEYERYFGNEEEQSDYSEDPSYSSSF